MTDAEALVWSRVRNRGLAGIKFKRQVPIAGFFADFASVEAKVVVEIDGGQHEERGKADHARTKRIEAAGYRVLRFWNNEILSNIEGVLEGILRELAKTK
jgi:very-short-patch-repair endonuclease